MPACAVARQWSAANPELRLCHKDRKGVAIAYLDDPAAEVGVRQAGRNGHEQY